MAVVNQEVHPWVLEQYKWHSYDEIKISTEVNWQLGTEVTVVRPGEFMSTGVLHDNPDGSFGLYDRKLDQYVNFDLDNVLMVGRTKGVTNFVIFLK